MVMSSITLAYRTIAGKIVTKDNLKQTINQALSEAGYSGGGNNAPAVTVTMDQVKSLFTNENLAFGDSTRKLLIVEFSDPSCPFCHLAAGKNLELSESVQGGRFKLLSQGGSYIAPVPEFKKLVDEGKASYVWLYTYGHANGELASQALYCADEKGKFWEAHDLLFSAAGYKLLNPQEYDQNAKERTANTDQISEFLKNVIDVSFMKQCVGSGKYVQKVKSDEAKASEFGVQGTPGFFINTTPYNGAYSFNDMKATVDEALKS
jgi:protein-disulfide isomerase